MRAAFLFAALCAPLAAATSGGMAVSVSSAGINYIISELIPIVEQAFENITIAGISGEKSGFDYSLSDIHCPTLSIPQFAVAFSAPNGMQINMGDVGLVCGADYWYKPKGLNILKQKGSVKIGAVQTSGTVKVSLEASNLEAQLAFQGASLTIGSLQLSFSGNWLDWLIDLFKPFIEDAIKKAFDDKFPSIFQTVVADANTALGKLKTFADLNVPAPYNIAEVRYGLVENPSANTGYIGVNLQGDIVPKTFTPNQLPPVTPPAIPPFNAASSQYYLEAQLSPYLFLSGVWTFWSANVINFPIPASRIPFGLNTTSAFGLIVPGLPSKYPGGTVSIDLSLASVATLAINPTGIATVWPFEFSFSVTPEGSTDPVPAFNFVADANISLTLSMTTVNSGSQLVINGDLLYLNADLVAGNSTVGPESGLSLLQDLVDFALTDVVVPAINKALVPGIPLPSFPDLTFTNVALDLEAGYALVGINFKFAPAAGAGATAAEAAEAAAVMTTE